MSARPVALFVSPHYDDVAFSCGATLVRLARRGWDVHLCTLFTRSVPDPAGFALACQLNKGLPAGADYMAVRRAEDDEFARRAGASGVHRLDHAEAPHRGYASAPELFGAVRPADARAWRAVAADLRALVRQLSPALLFAPQALGGHVDHRHAVRAVRAVRAARTLAGGAAPPVAWYRDAPYAARRPEARPPDSLGSASAPGGACAAVDVADALAAKLDAVAAYATQLGFQFGGEGGMRAALAAWAADEGARAAPRHALAERFLVDERAHGALRDALPDV